jgi:hypothetical protein
MCAATVIVTVDSSPQTTAPQRRFRLVDTMMLVAAMAIGFGLLQSIGRAAKRSPYDWCLELFGQGSLYELWDYRNKVLVFSLLATPLVAMITLAVIAIRFVGTRPRFRRLARQPGLVASCASSMAILFTGIPVIVGARAAGASWDETSSMLAAEDEVWSATMYAGLAVFVSWMTLLVSGRCRAERSWVDRLGRSLGVYWIVAAFALSVAFFLFGETSCAFRFKPATSTLVSAVGRTSLQLVTVLLPLIVLLSLVLIPIRLLGKRAPFRRLGMMAMSASGAAIALVGLRVAVALLAAAGVADDGLSWQDLSEIPAWLLDEEMVASITKSGGLSVLVSWVTLLIGRQWRAEPRWADRVGRAAGFCWIVAGFSVAISNVLILTDHNRYVHTHSEKLLHAVSDAAP